MDTFSMEYFVSALAFFFFLLFCQTSITVNKKMKMIDLQRNYLLQIAKFKFYI